MIGKPQVQQQQQQQQSLYPKYLWSGNVHWEATSAWEKEMEKKCLENAGDILDKSTKSMRGCIFGSC